MNKYDLFCKVMGYTQITTNGEVLYAKLPNGGEEFLGLIDHFEDFAAIRELEKRKKEIDELIEMFKKDKNSN